MAKIRHKEYDFLFFTDLQLGERKDLNVPTESGLNSRLLEGIDIVEQVGVLAEKYKVKRIFLLGDVFELKDRIPARIMILFSEAVKKYPCPLTILKGNHDFAEDDYAPIKLLEREGRIEFVSEPGLYEYNGILSLMLPYYRKYEAFKEMWIKQHKMELLSDIKLFMFHNTVPGAKFSNNRKAEGEFDLPIMKNVRYLAGDVHIAQKVGPVQYLGSPYQVDFGEEGQDKFVYLYKASDDTLVPVELNYPKFVSYDISIIQDEPDPSFFEGNYVRIMGEVLKEKKEQAEECKKIIESYNPKFVISAVKFRADKKARIETVKSDHQAVLSEFLQQSETELDKQKLLEVGLDLIKEVQT
jgi:DNA repair exonuclease SbcCD nuclease subunit